MASVTYRKVGKQWHIRFRDQGKSEITKSLPSSLQEKTIQDRVIMYKEEMALDKYDPWEEREKQQREARFNIKLSEVIELYIKDGKISGRWKMGFNGNCRTADTNQQRLEYLLEFIGNISVGDLEEIMVTEFITNYPGSAYSKKSILSTINTFTKWLYEREYKEKLIKVSVPNAIKDKAREISNQVRGISFYELKRICVGLRIRDKQLKSNKYAAHYESREWAINALLFTFSLMLRRSEINKIYPVDITKDFKEITIGNLEESFRPEFIPKGGIKTVPTTLLAQKVLKEMNIHKMSRHQPIIKHTNDQVYRKLKEGCYVVVYKEGKKTGKKRPILSKNVRLHDLRHGGIMHYRSKGWPDSLVSQLARHANSEVTSKIYGGIDPAELKRTLNHFDQEVNKTQKKVDQEKKS